MGNVLGNYKCNVCYISSFLTQVDSFPYRYFVL